MSESSNNENNSKPSRKDSLDGLRRARSRLFVCFWTFPVYVVVVTRLLNAGIGINMVMYAYMALYAGFGLHLALKRCPDCGEQFFVKTYFMNPFPRQCAHCGLSLKHSG